MLRRLVPATAAVGLLLAGLTACSAQPAASTDCEATLQPGALSNGVTVLGAFGEAPEVSVPEKGLKVGTTQRTVVTEAEGRNRLANEGSLVSARISFFDSKSGKTLYESAGISDPSQGPELLLVSKDTANPLSEAVRCTAAGDRVVLGIEAEEGAQLAAQLGSDPSRPLVGVIDVLEARPTHAQGPTRGLPAGYPAVVTNDEGRPGVVLPPRDAPKGTSSASRVVGDGAKVTAENRVIAQVLRVGWDGEEQENTWTTGPVDLGNEQGISTSGFTFRGELTGKTVGSQVVIVENTQDVEPRVVVVDILAAL
jgi:hypothetical protein